MRPELDTWFPALVVYYLLSKKWRKVVTYEAIGVKQTNAEQAKRCSRPQQWFAGAHKAPHKSAHPWLTLQEWTTGYRLTMFNIGIDTWPTYSEGETVLVSRHSPQVLNAQFLGSSVLHQRQRSKTNVTDI